MQCKTCDSLSGEKRISPGQQIYEGNYWVIEHTFPSKIKGWLVLVLKRHVTALHDLTGSEMAEMAVLQSQIISLLHKLFNCEKEYMAVFAEAPGFEHVHVHFVPKPLDLDDEFKGPKIFQLVGVKVEKPIPEDEISELCLELKKLF